MTGEKWQRTLAGGDGWTVLVERWTSARATLRVAASDPELLEKVVADVRSRAPVVEPRPETVSVEFWYQGRCRATTVRRRLDVPTWDEIAAHYTADVRRRLDGLMAMTPPDAGGRLLLWHGRPGTGKTTAIRALARSWSAWCSTLYVVDPEQFLGSAEYLLSVLLESTDDDAMTTTTTRVVTPTGRAKWRLLVLEDADELLRVDAKRDDRPGPVPPAQRGRRVPRPGRAGPGADQHQRAPRAPPPGGDPSRPVPGRGRVHAR